mgnify:CR=1 FL=1
MAISVTISLDSVCAGGGHAFIAVAVDGGGSTVRQYETDDLRGALTAQDRDTLIRLLVKAKLAGMTRAQARNTLQTGFTVTL